MGLAGWFLAAGVGCREPAPEPMRFDAGLVRRDVGPIDAFVPDIPEPDAGPRPDAWRERPDASRGDAGRDAGFETGLGLVVDGRLTDRAWTRASELGTTGPATGIFDGVYVRRFLVLREGDELALGLEGEFPSETAVVAVYLDLAYPDLREGVLLTAGGLDDRTGAVDAVLSNAITSVDAMFRPELGWGAGRRPEPATTVSPTLGWRALAQDGPHAELSAQRNACGASACESVLSLAALGVSRSATLGLVMRVGDPRFSDVWASRQTIPDDPDPEYITTVLAIPAVD